jgi:CheY-like chemotaxis protein
MNSNLKTILVVEDEKDILSTLKEYLEFEGFNVLTAENGLLALDILNKSQMPNLILLDMKMPKMNGWEFAAEYSKKYKNAAPIIVTTAAVDAEQRAKDAEAVDWVEKPFDLDFLLQKIKKHAR